MEPVCGRTDSRMRSYRPRFLTFCLGQSKWAKASRAVSACGNAQGVDHRRDRQKSLCCQQFDGTSPKGPPIAAVLTSKDRSKGWHSCSGWPAPLAIRAGILAGATNRPATEAGRRRAGQRHSFAERLGSARPSARGPGAVISIPGGFLLTVSGCPLSG